MADDNETGLDPDKDSLPRDIQNRIGRRLRSLYGDVLEEPVPDHFRALLDSLEAGQKGQTPP